MQPGVFCISCWDLLGALPLARNEVPSYRIGDGDYRWVNRGGVDPMGLNPGANESSLGLRRANHIYQSLPEQMRDSQSFLRRLADMLATREEYKIAQSELQRIPEPANVSVCILPLVLPEHAAKKPRFAITALNFGRRPVREVLDLCKMFDV